MPPMPSLRTHSMAAISVVSSGGVVAYLAPLFMVFKIL